MQTRHLTLYLLVLVLVVGMVIMALGGGLFGQQQFWLLQWQHQALANLCHQIADRSFWIGGQPMAVCSRCLGIYGGLAFGWLLLPFAGFWKINSHRSRLLKKLLIAMAVMNLIDIVGNYGSFWENTLTSRLILGGLLGIAAAVLFSGVFFNRKKESTGKYYGKLTTRGI
ncbi:Uncharacterized membrane protein [Fodinibius roseus]|uniref:Uncharacterized membrane protein n=1 Tax=Fodinibius roseus TaxID=1194090 RepID=A0A1M4XX33_9BACT|nr:DUF2085 domain-containing protein [Fodinibius roseus]SHE98041.1 Uncharacterized membrane protein [Fodinibius roseus]